MASLGDAATHYSTTRQNAIEDANKMQASVLSECAASGKEPPPYHFSELIGKGSFGRVYKARHPPSGKLVAIKVINIEIGDAESGTNTLGDILKEIETLKLLGDTGARNINTVLDALLLGHRVWMITEYCAGGSVSTLMRPKGHLPEQWIIPILREVAEAIYWTHRQGVIHRDIKCANVLVTEEGGVRLCDFGVAAIVTTKFDKRSTFTGSLHWMAPELFNPAVQYGTEVDIWAFGSMAFEVASGLPPNAGFRDINRFGTYLKCHQPKLQGEEYSAGLRDLIDYCVVEDPAQRPAIELVQLHPYIYDTGAQYPTVSLSKLVQAYKLWEAQGGSRLSLFSAGGAQMEADSSSPVDPGNEWIFSTMDDVDELPGPGQDSLQFVADAYDATIGPPSKQPRTRRRRVPSSNQPPVAPLEKLFDPNTLTDYQSNSRQFYSEFGYPLASDLPLRDNSSTVRVRESLIDLDAALGVGESSHMKGRGIPASQATDSAPSVNRRRTLEWKFPTLLQNPDLEPQWSASPYLATGVSDVTDVPWGFSTDNRASTAASLIDLDASLPRQYEQASRSPVIAQPGAQEANGRDSTFSLIDLDDGLPTGLIVDSRPSTAGSNCASSFSEPMPFGLEHHTLSPGLLQPTYSVTASVHSGDHDGKAEPRLDSPEQQRDNLGPEEDSSTALAASYLNSPLGMNHDLPPPPAPPASNVLEGHASGNDVKGELSRLISSLRDHLTFVSKAMDDHFEQ